MKNKLFLTLGLAALAGSSFGQIVSSSTTLSAAISAYTTDVCVASATNINTPSLSGATYGSILLVDKEAMTVQSAGATSTCFNVQRGSFASSFGGGAVAHGNAELVWVLQPVSSTSDPSRPNTAAEFLSNRQYQSQVTAATPPPVIGTSLTDKTDSSTHTYFSAVVVEHNTISTGACMAQGSADSDSFMLAIYDAHGNLIATTATAGTASASGTESLWLCIPWVNSGGATAQPLALTDGMYFVALQGNGSTADSFFVYPAGTLPSSYPTGSVASTTFGTAPNPLTITTSFTAAVGPAIQLY